MAFKSFPRQGRAPRVVAIIPSYIASCQINVIKPLSALESAGHIKFKHVLEQNANSSHIAWADLIVFCRNTEPAYRHLLSEAIGKRKPVIYDIDDSFWDISASTDPDLARYHLQPLRLKQLEIYLSYANLVRVYSPLLQTRVARFNENSRIYRSSFDFSKLPSKYSSELPSKLRSNLPSNLPSALLPTANHVMPCRGALQAPNPLYSKKVSIVYATSRIVDDQYKVFLPALAEFMREHHESVHVTIWGCSPPELLTLPGVTAKKLMDRYDDFLKEFARSGFEIGLAPLEDHEFNRSKNNTKFRDYGACGIAGIYSNVEAYSSSITDGHDGLLVENTKEAWYAALEKLVAQPELRKSIQRNAKAKVFADYRQELIEEQWLRDIDELLDDAPAFLATKVKNVPSVRIAIEAESDGMSGVELKNVSAHRGILPQNKVYLEVQTKEGSTLRGSAQSVITHDTAGGSITFNFDPIRHSKAKAFQLVIAGLSSGNNSQEQPYSIKYSEV